uniref:hypothetical protein n=1 Tax=Serratia quinivorans TaxID=137545 RepID=UPI0035C77141
FVPSLLSAKTYTNTSIGGISFLSTILEHSLFKLFAILVLLTVSIILKFKFYTSFFALLD